MIIYRARVGPSPPKFGFATDLFFHLAPRGAAIPGYSSLKTATGNTLWMAGAIRSEDRCLSAIVVSQPFETSTPEASEESSHCPCVF